MKINPICDLLVGNRPENDSDTQYYECEDCHRYEICKKYGCIEACSLEEIKEAKPSILEPSYDLSKQEGYFEMSMISEQVKELRRYCTELEKYGGWWNNQLSCKIKEAADTIEVLSAKVAAANMERSEIYYGGKKQRSLTINIQIGKDETASDIMELLSEIIDETNDKGYGVMNALVDGMEVFDYKGFSKEFFNPKE